MIIIGNVTGAPVGSARLQSPEHWSEHLRRCVRFSDGLGVVLATPGLALLECGPSHTLCSLALRDARRTDARAIAASFDGDEDPEREWRRILASAGALWSAGLPVELEKLFALQGPGRRISLPGYSFQRKSYWLGAPPSSVQGPLRHDAHGPATAPPEEDSVLPLAASGNAVEQRVIALMHELLGPVRLGPDSDFFLCGGDSLTAVRLTSRIGTVFGVQPTRAEIMKARTPANIAVLLDNGGVPKPNRDVADACLVRLATGDEGLAPIVLVHAIGGGAFIYQDLLQALASRHPVYGLQAPGLWDDAAPIDGLRAQARHYYNCLRRAGIDRPIMIAGSSYGGLVAYELDRRYRESGHQTKLVALFDSPGPGHMPDRLEDEAEIFAYLFSRDTANGEFAADLAQMEALDHAGRFARLLERARQAWMPDATREDLERLVRVFRQNLINLWNWIPQPHDARLLFCKAREPGALFARDPELAWVPLAPGGIEILPVPGDHSSMLCFPHVHQLARELNRRLTGEPVSRAPVATEPVHPELLPL